MGKGKNRRNKPPSVGPGDLCARCGSIMDRVVHHPDWKPREGQPYYFRYWDKCGCGMLQHYEAAKVHITEENPLDAEYRQVMGSLI